MNTPASEMGIGEIDRSGRPRVKVGKGSSPRHCFSDEFRANYDNIDWGREDDKSYDKDETQGRAGC